MTTRSPATIADVARHAGVSTATVSFVLNTTRSVTPGVRDRVLASSRALDYRPSHAAWALRTGRTATIGLIIPDLTNPFFPKLAQDTEREAAGLGYAVLLADSHDDPDEQTRAVLNLAGHGAECLVVIPALGSTSLPGTAVPVVILDRTLGAQPPAHTAVTSDEYAGGGQAVGHLLGLGHATFAVLAGPSQRVQGMLDALQAAGIGSGEVQLVHSADTAEGGREAVLTLLEGGRSFTALLATSDTLALGALSALQHAGKRVPEDLSVLGFDDIPWAALSFPALSTVRQQTTELARQAVAVALGKAQAAPVPTELVVRGSCGPAGGKK